MGVDILLNPTWPADRDRDGFRRGASAPTRPTPVTSSSTASRTSIQASLLTPAAPMRRGHVSATSTWGSSAAFWAASSWACLGAPGRHVSWARFVVAFIGAPNLLAIANALAPRGPAI
jgi:hypothetical protein